MFSKILIGIPFGELKILKRSFHGLCNILNPYPRLITIDETSPDGFGTQMFSICRVSRFGLCKSRCPKSLCVYFYLKNSLCGSGGMDFWRLLTFPRSLKITKVKSSLFVGKLAFYLGSELTIRIFVACLWLLPCLKNYCCKRTPRGL